MDTIFLTGFMGAGKTTIGRELGKRLSMTVFDTDEMIEQLCKKSVTTIFEQEGEIGFREHERTILQKIAWPGVIVTTGGGIVVKKENRQFMRKNGVVIYLHSDPEAILRRLESDATRPLLKDDKERQVMRLLDARLPHYLEADYAVNTTFKSVDTIADEITGFLSRDERFWA